MACSKIKVIGITTKYEIDMFWTIKDSRKAKFFLAKRIPDGCIFIAKRNLDKNLNSVAEEEFNRLI